jgi:D-arabinose 1-dehydrogenase-like Zn-dependent alcohol dehydrogenase
MRSYRMTAFGAPLEATDADTPEPVGTQVLMRVRAAGVCHSDLRASRAIHAASSARGSLRPLGVAKLGTVVLHFANVLAAM